MNHTMDAKKETLVVWLTAIALWILNLLAVAHVVTKELTVCLALASAVLVLLCGVRKLWRLPAVLLMGYVVFAGFGAVYAMSGKFFLQEYSKLILVLPVFLYILLTPQGEEQAFARRTMKVMALFAAFVAVLSVELTTTGLFRKLVVEQIHTLSALSVGYVDNRIYGVFGNSNVEGSLDALGVLAALGLLSGAESRKERIFAAVLCALNAFGVLMAISIGSMMALALAVVVYLIAAGKARMKLLVRMLLVAVPTVVLAAVSHGLLWRESALHMLPLLLMALNAAVAALLEVRVMDKLSPWLEQHSKLPLMMMLALVGLVVVYLIAAMNLTSAYTFTQREETLHRADDTAPGSHTLTIAADGPVQVNVIAQSRFDILQKERPLVFEGTLTGEATFTVPEDAVVCYYDFSAPAGTKLTEVTIDGTTRLPLQYTVLPSFVADRLQGAWTSDSLVIRQALWDYGIRLFRMSPVVGLGVGAYESGIQRVEDFVFESKYTHNHYIQVLLECGVIGFALYMAALLSLAVVLVKKRRCAADAELGWAYSALAAMFTLFLVGTAWDVIMSYVSYQGLSFAMLALIIRLFADSLPLKQPDTAALSKKGQAAAEQRVRTRDWVIRGVCAVFPALFALTVAGNIMADTMATRPVSSYGAYYNQLAQAASLDLYEYNDSKLTYVVTVGQQQDMDYYEQANRFAEELLECQSNAIPAYMLQYYVDTAQYEKALDAAFKAAEYSAADPDTWNTCFTRILYGIVLSEDGLVENMDTLLPLLLEYRGAFDARNASAIEAIELREPAQTCYELLGELEAKEQSSRQEAEAHLQEVLEGIRLVSEAQG